MEEDDVRRGVNCVLLSYYVQSRRPSSKKSCGKQVPEVSPQLLFSYLGVLIICRHKFASYNGFCSSLWVGKVQHGALIVNILKHSSGN